MTRIKMMLAAARLSAVCLAFVSAACGVPNPVGAGGSGGGPSDTCPASNRPTASLALGWATNPAFRGYNITYPTDGQPFGGIVIITGFIVGVSAMADWGPYLAARGVATFLIDPPGPGDLPPARSAAQLAALESLKAEASRPGSPLNGKLDLNRLAIAGWSMGGGGTLNSASTNPPGVKAAVALAPWQPGATYPNDHVPTLILAGGSADTLVAHAQSRAEYDSLSASTPRAYIELNGADHFQFTTPASSGGRMGTYMWAWLNSYMYDATQCKALITSTPAMADFASDAL